MNFYKVTMVIYSEARSGKRTLVVSRSNYLYLRAFPKDSDDWNKEKAIVEGFGQMLLVTSNDNKKSG